MEKKQTVKDMQRKHTMAQAMIRYLHKKEKEYETGVVEKKKEVARPIKRQKTSSAAVFESNLPQQEKEPEMEMDEMIEDELIELVEEKEAEEIAE